MKLQVRRRDESIKQLQEDLMESQAQYSACYNEVGTLRIDFRDTKVYLVFFPIYCISCIFFPIPYFHS